MPSETIRVWTLLRLAASFERGSEHPRAAAIVRGAAERGVALEQATDFQSITGKGVQGRVGGKAVNLGNKAMMAAVSVDLAWLEPSAGKHQTEGQTVMFVAVDGVLAELVGVADPIKSSSAGAIRALHTDGVRIVMLTGDNETTAQSVAKELGIDDVIAGVLPDQKAEQVKTVRL